MILKKPLNEIINIFISSITRLSATENPLNLNFETTIKVVKRYNDNFYLVSDATEGISVTVAMKLKKPEKLLENEKYNVRGFLEIGISNKSQKITADFYTNLIIEAVEPCSEIIQQSPDILAVIKNTALPHRDFPNKDSLNISIICPSSSMSESIIDFRNKIENSGFKNLSIKEINCNITNIESVAKAIKESPTSSDILIITRGGGDKSLIQALDDILIIEAIKPIDCYKMIGIGHASDRLAIEMMFDHVSQTPTEIANKIISELTMQHRIQKITNKNAMLQNKLNNSDIVRKDSEIKKLTEENKELHKLLANSNIKQQSSRTTDITSKNNKNQTYKLMIAFLAGAIIYYLIFK